MLAKNKYKEYITYLGIVLAMAGLIVLGKMARSQDESQSEKEESKAPVAVTVKPVDQLRTREFRREFPAVIEGDQEVIVRAGAAGTVASLNFNLGDAVGTGKFLARIDDFGGHLSFGESGYKSSEVTGKELAEEIARQSYKLAKEVYEKDSSHANSRAKKIAKLQYENAQLDLSRAINDRNILAPIGGFVTSRSVALGDSISEGQEIAKISKTIRKKAVFFVEKEIFDQLKVGVSVSVADPLGNTVSAKISRIAPQADQTTHRYRVEALFENGSLDIGLVSSVWWEKEIAAEEGKIILPLAALSVGQNETAVWLEKDGKAVKKVVVIDRIAGEWAYVWNNFSAEDRIVIDGGKELQEGILVETGKEG